MGLEPDFGEIEWVLKHLGNHPCNLYAWSRTHGRKSLNETRTYTPKSDVLDRTHGGGDGESVVGHGGNEENVGRRATALHLSSSKLAACQLFQPRR